MSKRKKAVEQQIRDGLCELAFGKISDAASLLYMTDEEALSRLPRLRLMNVSEIKRVKGGGMEIKFFDRLKAIERLNELEGSSQDSPKGFYQALEKSVSGISQEAEDND